MGQQSESNTTRRQWDLKRQSILRELQEIDSASPVFDVLQVENRADEIRAIAVFKVATLVRPNNDELRTRGPTITGIRYHKDFIRRSPIPWEIVTVLSPHDAYHPNSRSGALCLGRPPAGIAMKDVLHLTYAAITLQSFDAVEWHGLDAEAAAFVRRHVEELPLLETGLLEHPGQEHIIPLDALGGLA